MNKIIYDIELLPKQPNEDLWNYYKKYTKQIKNKRDLVKLGLYCAKYCFEYNNEETKPYAQKCIELVEKYLIDSNLVTEQELYNVAYAANAYWSDIHAASYAVIVAADATAYNADYTYTVTSYAAWSLYYCSKISI